MDIKFGLRNKKNDFSGLEIGLIDNKNTGNFVGFSFSPWINSFENFTGTSVAFAGNIVEKDVNGSVYAGFLNAVDGDVNGSAYAGLFNGVDGDVNGSAYAGVLNGVEGNVNGSAYAGLFNGVDGDVNGSVYAGLFNDVKKDVNGSAYTIGINGVKGNVNGSVKAIGGNIVEKDVNGSAYAGVLNLILGNLTGRAGAAINYIQGKAKGCVSGLVTLVGELYGNQRGLVFNYCGEDAEGTQFGFINYQAGGKWYERFSPIISVRKPREAEKERRGETGEASRISGIV